MRVLLVEDDPVLASAVRDYLTRDGWAVDVAPTLAVARGCMPAPYVTVVLDLGLPDGSGLSLLPLFARQPEPPAVLVLTAQDRLSDRVRGLDAGADDYLVKPFSPRELVARVRALLRRAHVTEEPQRDRLVYGDLEIDVASHKAFRADRELELTASEFKLLVTLARYPGRVYSRMELVEKVLGYDFEGYERTIDSHVKNLRAKLDDDPRSPTFIYTVHGVGYRFEAPEDAEDQAARDA